MRRRGRWCCWLTWTDGRSRGAGARVPSVGILRRSSISGWRGWPIPGPRLRQALGQVRQYRQQLGGATLTGDDPPVVGQGGGDRKVIRHPRDEPVLAVAVRAATWRLPSRGELDEHDAAGHQCGGGVAHAGLEGGGLENLLEPIECPPGASERSMSASIGRLGWLRPGAGGRRGECARSGRRTIRGKLCWKLSAWLMSRSPPREKESRRRDRRREPHATANPAGRR